MLPYFKIAQCIEWCTDLPLGNIPRESPIFRLKGKEWFFRFILRFEGGWSYEDEMDIYLGFQDKGKEYWTFELFLEQRDKRSDIESYRVDYKVGYENEDTFNLGNGVFNLTDHHIWSNCWFNWSRKIKFRFYFGNVDEPLLRNSNETESNAGSQNSSIIELSALSRDFSKLLDESSDYDVEIKCEDETFQAHKNVLGVRSPVLSAMLKSNMKEGETGLIQIKDIKASIFRSFLCYLYTGTLSELSIDTVKQLYKVGDKYAVEELKKACSECLVKNLGVDNACEIVVLADQHSDDDFRKCVISYIIDKKIPENDEFSRDFCKSHPLLANEIMILFIQRHRSK